MYFLYGTPDVEVGAELGETREVEGGSWPGGRKINFRWSMHVLGAPAPTSGDESVGRWHGRERFFPEGFNVGGHL